MLRRRSLGPLLYRALAKRGAHGAASSVSYLHNPGTSPLRYETVGEALGASAKRHPARLALRSLHEQQELSYAQLLTRADALGCALRGCGLQRGDRVALWSHNCLAWPLAMLAALRVGLVPVAINPTYEAPELRFCLNKTEAKALVVGAALPTRDYYGLLTQLVPELPGAKPGDLQAKALPDLRLVLSAASTPPPGTLSIDELADGSGHDVEHYGAQVCPDDGSIIHFTSGTTGEPKAALDTHMGVVNNSYWAGQRLLLDVHEAHVCVQTPLFHALGSVVALVSALQHGATALLPAPHYSASASTNALFNERCSVLIGTPTMFVDLVAAARLRGPPPPVRVALTAGAPCSPQLFQDIKQYLNVQSVKSLYGMTETTGTAFQSLEGESQEVVTSTVGYIQEHVEAKVVDADGRAVPWGERGELLVRGYNIMRGYWGEPELTQRAFAPGGWLRTGDLFTLSPDGYGRVVGRLKDIIVRGGENVAPKEIEDVLDEHPDVMQSQVVGVADERLGEELAAVLRLREGATSPSLEELQAHCAGRLARHKLPRSLHVLAEFPKTGSGKVQKYRLREMIEAGEI